MKAGKLIKLLEAVAADTEVVFLGSDFGYSEVSHVLSGNLGGVGKRKSYEVIPVVWLHDRVPHDAFFTDRGGVEVKAKEGADA